MNTPAQIMVETQLWTQSQTLLQSKHMLLASVFLLLVSVLLLLAFSSVSAPSADFSSYMNLYEINNLYLHMYLAQLI